MKKLILIFAILLIGVGSSSAYNAPIFNAGCPYTQVGYTQGPVTIVMPMFSTIYIDAYIQYQGCITVTGTSVGEPTKRWYKSGPINILDYFQYFSGSTTFTLVMDNPYLGPGRNGGTVSCTVFY